jgi:hypothetical protein
MLQRINIMVASPGDVPDERNAVQRVFIRWNERNTFAILHPRMWESASVPALGGHPQQILDEQMIKDCDLLVAILWSRLGTPTPTDRSGTLEEIREFSKVKGPGRVMLYFCNRSLPYDVDIVEFSRLREFKDEMKVAGLFHEFTTCDQFESLLYQHLDAKVPDVVDGKLPIPRAAGTKGGSGLAAPMPHSDPIDFGRTLPAIAEAFTARMEDFSKCEGGGRQKYLVLGAHVYYSCADCLDRLLSRHGNQMRHEDKSAVDRIITDLRSLADTHGDYTRDFQAFWARGEEIARNLAARAKRVGNAQG